MKIKFSRQKSKDFSNCKLKIILPILFCFMLISSASAAAPSDVSLTVDDPCNYNNTCDVYETEANCSSDCGCDNDGICETNRGETAINCPKDCGGGVVPIRDVTPPSIFNLLIVPTQQAVRINWRTDELTFIELRWGATQDLLEGTISKIDYATNYSVLIDGLLPDTTYYFEIQLRDKNHNKTVTELQSFNTLGFPDDIPPTNVSNFEAKEEEKEIELSWNNPLDPDFDEIRIVRNNQFYPKDPNDGEVVYQGSMDSYTDEEVFDEDYYYTIFAYDSAGNYSSGAILKAKPTKAPPAPIKPPTITPTDPPYISPEIERIALEDIVFIQDGEEIEVKDGSVLADAGKPMKISIAYDKLPEVLKTIIISLKKCNPSEPPLSDSTGPLSGRRAANPSPVIENWKLEIENWKRAEGSLSPNSPSSNGLETRVQSPESESSKADSCSSFSFLLKVDPQKTEYSATIVSPYEAGIYPIAVSILDFQHQELKELEGNLLLRKTIVPIQDQNINIWAIIGRITVFLTGLGLIFLLLRTIYRFFIRRKKAFSSLPSSH